MNFHRLDLNLLVALDALLSERSTTSAGERLHLTQSATSAALARLREYFGDDLLIPIGRRMVLTPLGHSLVAPVRDILIRVRATSEMRPAFDPSTSVRSFSLMMSDYLASILMAEATRSIHRQAPGVAIEILPPDDAPAQLLERGEVDFLAMPATCLSELHPKEMLLEDGYVCVVWKGNSLVHETLSLEQYLSFGHVERQFGKSRAPSLLDHFWMSRGYKRRIEVIVPTFNLVPQFIVGTTRIATLHTRLANIYAQHLAVRLVPAPVELPVVREAVQWHQYLNQDPGTIWMRRVLREAADRSGPNAGVQWSLPVTESAPTTQRDDVIVGN